MVNPRDIAGEHTHKKKICAVCIFGEIFAYVAVLIPTIEVVTFLLRGMTVYPSPRLAGLWHKGFHVCFCSLP